MKAFPPILAAILMIVVATSAVPGADAPAKAPVMADEGNIAHQLEAEIAKLEQLTRTLARVREQTSKTPEPEEKAVIKPDPGPVTARRAVPDRMDPAPVPVAGFKGREAISGTEEEFANCLYALGRYAAALNAYKVILESAATDDAKGWAGLQIGHCRRRLGNASAAQAAYMAVISNKPEGPWADEAGWWMAQVKWQLLWARPIAAAGPESPSDQQPGTRGSAAAGSSGARGLNDAE